MKCAGLWRPRLWNFWSHTWRVCVACDAAAAELSTSTHRCVLLLRQQQASLEVHAPSTSRPGPLAARHHARLHPGLELRVRAPHARQELLQRVQERAARHLSDRGLACGQRGVVDQQAPLCDRASQCFLTHTGLYKSKPWPKAWGSANAANRSSHEFWQSCAYICQWLHNSHRAASGLGSREPLACWVAQLAASKPFESCLYA